MKKRKLILLLPFSALVLGGCTFQEGWQTATGWLNDNIWQPVSGFVKDIFNPGEKEEKNEDEKATLKSLSISGDYKQTYSIGEEFDSTGIVVTANYSDNSKKDVTSEATFSGFSSATKGEVEVTVSYGGKSTTFTVTIVKSEWSSEDLALFDTYLHGFVLPFFDAPGFSLSYEQGWVAGKGCSITADELLAYEALFTEAAGYEDITSEYEDITDGSYKAFKHSVSTEQGTRYIDIVMYTFTGSSYSLGGQFVLQAKDAYNYEFPDTDALFEKYPLLTSFAIPTLDLPDGGYYYSAEGLYNEYYYQNEYYTWMTLTVWGYNASPETFAAFQAKFESYDVTESDGIFTVKMMVDETHYAEFEYLYDANAKIIKYYVTLGVYELQFWPTEEVAQMVEALVPGSTTVIPAFEGQEYDIYSAIEIDVYGSSTIKAEYIAILTGASWTLDPNATDVYISPAQDIAVEVYYNSFYGCLEITLSKYVAPSAEWPTEEVAALFPEGTGDVLPPFEGEANSFQVYSDQYGAGVLVFVGEDNQDAAMEAYASTLLEANFTVSEKKEGFYESPSKEYYVEIYKGTDGAIGIEVSMIPYFPSADLEEAVSALVQGAHSHFPAMEEAEKYTLTVATDGSKIRLVMNFSSSTLGPTKTSEYIDLLLENNFEFAGNDAYGDPMYQSTIYDYYVNVYTNYSSVVLDIYPGIFVPTAPGLPVDECMEILLSYYPGLKDTIPGYVVDKSFIVDDSGYYATIELGLLCESSSEASAHVAAYEAILLEANYTVGESGDYGGTVYFSPNQEIAVYPYVYGGIFYIDIDLMVY